MTDGLSQTAALRDQIDDAMHGWLCPDCRLPQALDAVMAVVQPEFDGRDAALRRHLKNNVEGGRLISRLKRENGRLRAAWWSARIGRALARRERDQAEAEASVVRAERRRWFERAEAAEAKVRDYENGLTWQTTCTGCARLLDACYAETMRAETAEAAIARVREIVGRWILPGVVEMREARLELLAALDQSGPSSLVQGTEETPLKPDLLADLRGREWFSTVTAAIECILLDHHAELDGDQVDANLAELADVYRQLTGWDAREEVAKDCAMGQAWPTFAVGPPVETDADHEAAHRQMAEAFKDAATWTETSEETP